MPHPALLRILLGIAVSSATAHAATYRWDFDGDYTTGTPGVATPGSGTWSTSIATWNNASFPDGNVAWSNGNAAQFGGGGGVAGEYNILVDSSVTTLAPVSGGNTSLSFVNSGFSLSANSAVSIAVGSAISIAPTATATLGNNLTFTGVTKINIGTSTDEGTGTLIIENGATVSNTSDLAIESQMAVQVKTGGTLEATRILLNGVVTPTLTVDGGNVNFTGTSLFVSSSNDRTAHVTLNSGAITGTSSTTSAGVLQFGPSSGSATAASGGIFDLNGGTLTVAQIKSPANNEFVNATFNFNGGVLKVKTATSLGTTFMTGLDVANVRNGGAIIDTNGQNVTIGQALVHSTVDGDNAIDGGLVKRGLGTLTLTGANTFTGDITIEAGTLGINSAFIHDTADVSVANGAVFALSFTGTDTIGSLTIGGTVQEIGTYGSLTSSAQFKSAFFTGNGILNVTISAIPEPSTAALASGLLAVGVTAIRRRRR